MTSFHSGITQNVLVKSEPIKQPHFSSLYHPEPTQESLSPPPTKPVYNNEASAWLTQNAQRRQIWFQFCYHCIQALHPNVLYA